MSNAIIQISNHVNTRAKVGKALGSGTSTDVMSHYDYASTAAGDDGTFRFWGGPPASKIRQGCSRQQLLLTPSSDKALPCLKSGFDCFTTCVTSRPRPSLHRVFRQLNRSTRVCRVSFSLQSARRSRHVPNRRCCGSVGRRQLPVESGQQGSSAGGQVSCARRPTPARSHAAAASLAHPVR
jgi:hypothetical protein